MKQTAQSCPQAALVERSLREPLTDAEQAALAEHLEMCPVCRAAALSAPQQAGLQNEVRRAASIRQEAAVDVRVPRARLSAQLPQFEVLEELGRGGMGVVFKARQRGLDRIVALKVLPALLGAVRPDALARFRREAKLAAALDHTNIIGVYEFGELDGTLYYVMQYVEGQSLAEVLRGVRETGTIDVVLGAGSGSNAERGSRNAEQDEPSARAKSEVGSGKAEVGASRPPASSLPTSDFRVPTSLRPSEQSAMKRIGSSSATDRAYYRRVARWMADVADGLHYAHEQGVIHRDVKPSNLLLNRTGRLMISDFGLARQVEAETLTTTRSLLGTARYMAPEQVDERGPEVDRRVDVYGLGATLYELLAFRPMFAAADDREVLDCVLNKEPTPPRRFVRQVPRELETICLKAVEKGRAGRYATAQALRDDLERWLLDLPIHAKRPSVFVRVGKFVRRRKLSSALGAIAAAALLTSATIYISDRATARTAAKQRIELIAHNAQRLIDREEDEAALKKAEEGLQLAPDSAALLNLKAAALMNLDRRIEAVDVLEAMLARHPDDILGHYRVARMMIGKEPLSAVGVYNVPGHDLDIPPMERRQRFEQHRDAVRRLGPDAKYAAVLAGLEESDPAFAVGHFDRALEQEKMWSDALELRAYANDKLHRYAAMLLDCERLVSVSPECSNYHNLRGRALGLLGRWQDAEQALSVAIARSPRNSLHWQNRSTARLKQGRAAEALPDAEQAIQLDEQNANAYLARASAYNGMGQYQRALPDLGYAMRLEPAAAGHAIARASVYYNLGQFEEAMADISRALELEPRNTRCLYLRSRVLQDLGHFERAVADLSEVVRLTPDDATAYRNRAQALARWMKYAEAVADYDRAIKLDGGTPSDFIGRALLFVETGQHQRAVADLSRLVDREDLGDEVRLRRGALYELMGDLESAEADYVAVSKVEGPLGRYAQLWRYLLLRMNRNDDAAAGVLADATAQAGLDPWIAKLYGVFRGETTPADLIASAATQAEACEAHYYIGMQALIDHRIPDARDAFDACVQTNQGRIIECDFARARLQTLQSTGLPGRPTTRDATP